jgi:predicted DsbA family dithiol-disulfide isomerase
VTEPRTVELWLDVSCPWCQGGLPVMRALLEEAAADPGLPPLRVVWRPVRLHPIPPEGLPLRDYLRRFTTDEAELAAMDREVTGFNVERGRELRLDRVAHLHDPRTAHRLLALARDAGADMWALADAVWDANWRDSLDVSSPAVLRAAVEAAGVRLDEAVWAAHAAGEGGDLVDADRARATEVGLDGVPRFGIGTTIVPAWIDVDEVRALLGRALAAA